MSLFLILALALGLGIVWRLVRLAVRIALLFALIALIAVYGARSSHSRSTTSPPSGTSARVAHVADGDTLTALTARGPMRVRLLGIDAPELTGTRFGHPTCGGRSAAIHLRALAPPGTSVRLVTDQASGDTYDAYHRCSRTSTVRTGTSARHSSPPARRSSTATAADASHAWPPTCVPSGPRAHTTSAPGARARAISAARWGEEALMSAQATTPSAGLGGPPWTAEATVYFHGGPLSNFAPTPGLRLPFGYHGHHENDRVPVSTVEHWFQACKATSRQQFDLILACGTAASAKRAGRETELRPDWEQVKFEVMLRPVPCPQSRLLTSALLRLRGPRLH